jgi:D-serine deaminase-like pyridoxal phosphate-dependent protein
VVFASWCDPCLKNLPAIVSLSRNTSARFIGIDALESLAEAKAVVAKYHVPFRVALLTNDAFERPGVTDEQRGTTGIDIPAVYVIDGRGMSYKAFVGSQASNVSAIRTAIHDAAQKN